MFTTIHPISLVLINSFFIPANSNSNFLFILATSTVQSAFWSNPEF